jgi:hypothetical protein
MFEREAMSKRSRFTALLVLLLLFSSFVAVPHFHEDLDDHDDCPICVATYHQSASGPAIIACDGIPCFTETTVITSPEAFTDNLYFFSLSTRGPPS